MKVSIKTIYDKTLEYYCEEIALYKEQNLLTLRGARGIITNKYSDMCCDEMNNYKWVNILLDKIVFYEVESEN